MASSLTAPPYYEHPVAELYALSTLDFVIEMATAVARDFFQRSHAYDNLPEDIGDKIIGFRSYLGSHPDWPNIHQRSSVYKILSKGNQLCSHAVSFRLAALMLSQQASATDQALTPAFHDSVVAFRAYVEKHDGRALRLGVRQIRTLFRTSVELLSNPELARVFLVDDPPKKSWPFDANVDANGACLLENINDTIILKAKGKLNTSIIFAKQRIAHHGARAMVDIVSQDLGGAKLSNLIQISNCWAHALRDLVPHVVKYWKSPDAMDELSEVERGQLPDNPAGRVDLQGLMVPTASGGQTATAGAVCCCDTVNFCDTDQDDCLVAEITTVPLDDGGHVDDWCDA
jgi:mersacidin/lichenicidin family type 2 lantibiotic